MQNINIKKNIESNIRVHNQSTLDFTANSGFNVLSDSEYTKIIYDFNDTRETYPKEICIHQLFEQQVKRNPKAVAMVYENKEYSYRQLDEMSNSLAHILREKGVSRNDIVAIVSGRSYKVIVAQLAVLKAGGAYLPIDPTYPKDRIEYMLSDANCRVVLSSGVDLSPNIINLNDEDMFDGNKSPLINVNEKDDLCYVIYTSGSTGKPKGTMLMHRTVNNYCSNNAKNIVNAIIPENIKVIASITTIGFDIFVTESLLPLLNGKTIVFANQEEATFQSKLSKLVSDREVEVLQTTPTKLRSLISDDKNLGYLKYLKVIMLGGEAQDLRVIHKVREHSDAVIYNVYGPTETTVWSTFSKIVGDDLTIGKPIANTQIYILDEKQNLLPVGEVGELCIAGDGVCKGYLNRPELTDEKFVKNPFGEGRMYKTGDLAKWREDGNIDFIGRIDNQVKIHGIRIELGEIEAAIEACDGIKQVVVADKKDESGRQFLCAYYIGDDIDIKAVKSKISYHLPQHMIPHFFKKLETLPTTPNGKIDRKALPLPDFTQTVKSAETESLLTETEKKITDAIASVLGLHSVGIDENFFELGGDSLTAIELLIELKMDETLTIAKVFEYPTAKLLSKFISGQGNSEQNLKTMYEYNRGDKKEILVCIPFSSGEYFTFQNLAAEMKKNYPDLGFYALRKSNWVDISIDDFVMELEQLCTRETKITMYGHCAGDAMAIRSYLHMNEKTENRVKQMVFAGDIPSWWVHPFGRIYNPWYHWTDIAIEKLLYKGGLDMSSLSKEAKKIVLKQFRKDAGGYFKDMSRMKGKSDVPTTFVFDVDDWFTNKKLKHAKKSWSKFISGEITIRMVDTGNHFFHKNNPDLMCEIISDLIYKDN